MILGKFLLFKFGLYKGKNVSEDTEKEKIMGINVSEIQDEMLLQYAKQVDDGDGILNEKETASLFEKLNSVQKQITASRDELQDKFESSKVAKNENKEDAGYYPTSLFPISTAASITSVIVAMNAATKDLKRNSYIAAAAFGLAALLPIICPAVKKVVNSK